MGRQEVKAIAPHQPVDGSVVTVVEYHDPIRTAHVEIDQVRTRNAAEIHRRIDARIVGTALKHPGNRDRDRIERKFRRVGWGRLNIIAVTVLRDREGRAVMAIGHRKTVRRCVRISQGERAADHREATPQRRIVDPEDLVGDGIGAAVRKIAVPFVRDKIPKAAIDAGIGIDGDGLVIQLIGHLYRIAAMAGVAVSLLL